MAAKLKKIVEKALQVEDTRLEGVKIITPRRFGDERGFFSESWSQRAMEAAGLGHYTWLQDNHSVSFQAGTIRGLHYQSPPHAQDKLVRCGRGALLDVVVDVRRGSPTYGKSVAVELSFENGCQLLVPAGFLHGFVTLKPDTEIIYKCSDYYAPDCDGAVYFASAGLDIDWGIGEAEAVLSPKDSAAVQFADFDSPFTYEGPAT